MKMVRAKFRVDTITRNYTGGLAEMTTIKMSPVYGSDDPNNENSKFWKYTPTGSLELGCVNPETVKQFELGKEYYLDFTPAPVPAPKNEPVAVAAEPSK